MQSHFTVITVINKRMGVESDSLGIGGGSERKDRMQTKVGSIDSISADLKSRTFESNARIFLGSPDPVFK